MTQSRSRQSGFTLIEISVVVIILATISAMSLFAINQAFDRRYKSQADNLLVWFNQLSDQAALEAVPYGIRGNPEDSEREVRSLRVIAYYRQHWFPVTYPESFSLEKGARVEWVVSANTDNDDRYESVGMDDEDALIPVVALMPDGYMEPRAEMILTFDSNPITFKYRWDEETAAMTMLRVAQ
ncbi:MAG: type II secretion system protein [Porticoccaceae bacterium]|nr:type II secretion system protein [Porticoccaceae bacterium]